MYFNTLIIMNEDALGYGNRSRKPSGYCKLTMPNRVSCYVQGLRQLPKGQIYKLYLTSKSKQQSVEVGMLQVGVSGNKETRWVMNPASINNSGVAAEEIDGAFIIVSGDDIEAKVVPLVGFSSEPYTWEHLVKNHNKTTNISKVENQSEREEIVEERAVKVDKSEEIRRSIENKQIELEPTVLDIVEKPEMPVDEVFIQDIKGIEDGQDVEDNIRDDEVLALKLEIEKLTRTIKESKQIIEQLQKQAIKAEKVIEPKEVASPEPINSEQIQMESVEPLEKVSGINEYINNFIRRFQATDKEHQRADCKEIDNIYEKRIPINPFQAQNTGIKWVRITHEDLAFFPSLDKEWTNQQLIIDAHRDYKHFILGKDESGLTYYLGIPGIFDPSKESLLNIDKIERFSCCHNVPPRAGEAGYWIAVI